VTTYFRLYVGKPSVEWLGRRVAAMSSWLSHAPIPRPIRRSQSRLRVRLPARLTTLTEKRDVILYDLCMHGAKLRANLPPRVGAEVVLEWQGCEAFGKVVWQRSGFFGLSFIDPITPGELIATRDLDDVARLANDRELNRQAAQSWVNGNGRL